MADIKHGAVALDRWKKRVAEKQKQIPVLEYEVRTGGDDPELKERLDAAIADEQMYLILIDALESKRTQD
jgi:hypothetical protein